ncbi:MAG TPA: LysM peptidoglycan-binding domain-containing protein [Atribacteraceae bacterium]|nr:LysM peptidoglycan-binding domain-containing protein [Atribacteraceae bacterium]
MEWTWLTKKGFLSVIAWGTLFLLSSTSVLYAAVTHTVQPGDTLWKISRQYDVPLEKIYELNGLTQNSLLRVGMNIEISGVGAGAASSFTYTIKPGDSLWEISRHYNVSLRALLDANGFTDQTILRVGQVITIPVTSAATGTGQATSRNASVSSMVTYTIKPGDSLWEISRHYNVSLRALLDANGFTDQTILRVGQLIRVPSSSPAASSTSTPASPTIHKVRSGESLWLISRIYGLSLRSIMEANSLNESSVLRVGMPLSIPVDAEEGTSAVSTSVQAGRESFTYTIEPGDSLWEISRKFGVNLQTLMSVNNLGNSSRLQINQILVIPGGQAPRQVADQTSREYEIYRVTAGDSLWSVSRRFRVSLNQLMSVNGLSQNSTIRIGQTLRIPAYISGNYGSRTERMAWPLNGRVSSPYGRRGTGFHTGIDIPSPAGTPIRAAMSGVVSFSGWMRGYGRTVIIDHPNGIQTLYAHNQVNLVSRGQRVNQGDSIARVGMSGNATGYHSHFEIRRNGRHLDPMEFLSR